jgi:hypothetical protein
MSHQQALLILLATLAIVAKAQRPLNTTNTSNLLTEPFFIKPTSTSNRNAIPEMRAAGGSRPERPPYPSDVQYSHGYLQKEHLQPPRHQPIEKKLHKVDPARMRKMENNNYKKSSIHDLRQTLNDPNHELNQPGRNNSYTHGVQIFHAKPNEPLPPKRFEFDNKHINPDEFAPQQPPIPNSPFKDLKDQLINRTYMHTPSPPSNFEDYDVDEKLGVKCTFEKPCTWTYDEADGSNFFVTSGANLTAANMTGELFKGT